MARRHRLCMVDYISLGSQGLAKVDREPDPSRLSRGGDVKAGDLRGCWKGLLRIVAPFPVVEVGLATDAVA